jgi:hypothetical protein
VISAPQGKGIPGWIWLTRNPTPIAYWIPRKDTPNLEPIRMALDERCYEDSILRVERTATHFYIADVWMWNGTPIFHKTSFQERQTFLEKIYTLYTPSIFETLPILLRSAVTDTRGKEYYTDDKGVYGIYIENVNTIEIVKTDIPDVYRIPSVGEYLRVQTLALSKRLRTLGDVFHLVCTRNEDGTWTPKLDS